MSFDPDAFLAERQQETFDPDAFLAERNALKLAKQPEPAQEATPEQEVEPPAQPAGIGRKAASLVTEIAVGEAGRMAATAAGAMIGSAIPVVGTVAGGVAGFILGGLGSGALASYLGQTIEGAEEIDEGRMVRDSIINTIPLVGSVRKGSKVARVAQSAVQQGLIGGTIGVAGEMIETGINEKRLATLPELTTPFLFGAGLGGGLGVTQEIATGLYRKFAGMTPRQVSEAISSGDFTAISAKNAIDEVMPQYSDRPNMKLKRRIKESVKDVIAPYLPTFRFDSIPRKEMLNYVDQISPTARNQMLKLVESATNVKAMRQDFTVKAEAPVRINETLTLSPGQVLKQGTDEHAKAVEYTIKNILEGNDNWVDPISGKLMSKAVVGLSEDGSKILRFTDLPDWIDEDAAKVLADAKDSFRTLAQRALELHQTGIRPMTDELAAKIAQSINEDNYLPRVYRFFEDSTYQPSKQAVNELKAVLRDRGMEDGDIAVFLKQLNEKRAADPIDALALMNRGLSGIDIFKKRKLTDNDRALREYLGEVSNPAERIATGFMQLQRYVAEAEAMQRVLPRLFNFGYAKRVQDIPTEELAANMWKPLRIGGVEARIKDVTVVNSKGNTFPSPVGIKIVPASFSATEASKYQSFAGNAEESIVMVQDSFQKAINALTGQGFPSLVEKMAQHPAGRGFVNAIAASKFVKVVLNPGSWTPAIYSPIISMATNGFNPFQPTIMRAGRMVRLSANPTATDVVKALSTASMDELLDLQKRGLLDRNITTKDLGRILSAKSKSDNAVSRLATNLGQKYAFVDDTYRVAQYYLWRNTMEKAVAVNPGGKRKHFTDDELARLAAVGVDPDNLFSAEDIKDAAQALTRATFSNYGQINRVLKDWSMLGVISQFANFWLDLIRVYANKAVIAHKFMSGIFSQEIRTQKFADLMNKGLDSELNHKIQDLYMKQMDDVLRPQGQKMIVAMTLAASAATTGVITWNRSHGIDSEMEDRMRELVYDWDKNQNILFDFDPERGHLMWKNASYLADIAAITNVFQALSRGEDLSDAATKSLEAFLAPLAGEGPFILQNLFPAFQNYNPRFGTRISESPNALQRSIEQGLWYASETFMPGFVREYDRITRPENKQPVEQTVQRLFGVRWNDRSLEDLVKSQIREMNTTLNTTRANLNRDLRMLHPSMHEQAYAERNSEYQQNFQRVIRIAESVNFIGRKLNPDHTEDDTIKMLKDSGLASREALAAVDGRTPSLPRVKRETSLDLWDAIATLPRNEQRAEIEAIENPAIRRDVMRRYRNDIRDEQRGISERDRIYRSMRTDERAQAIWEVMQASSNPDQKLLEFRRKGLVSSQVMRQIDLLRQQE